MRQQTTTEHMEHMRRMRDMKKSSAPKRSRDFRSSVTFENWTTAPQSTRMDFSAGSVFQAVNRALREARREHPHAAWRSLVIVIEKLDATDDVQAELKGTDDGTT
jgi:hypothetical protein